MLGTRLISRIQHLNDLGPPAEALREARHLKNTVKKYLRNPS